MGKISKKKKQEFIRVITFVVVLQVVLISLFTIMLSDTQKAKKDNTYILDTRITDVKVKDIPNKLTTLYLNTPVDSYRITWKVYEETYNFVSFENLRKDLMEDSSLKITVLEKSKKYSAMYGETLQVVDIRSDETVYFDVTNYNQWQKSNRIILFFTFAIVEMALITVSVFLIYLNNPFYNKKKKRL